MSKRATALSWPQSLLYLVLMLTCFSFASGQYAETQPTHPPSNTTGLGRYISNQSSTQKVTLNFTNIETRKLLQLFAQFTNTNFIISDNVKGNMSIHLKNIPWPQALNAILKSQGLAQKKIGDAVIIAPLTELQQEQMQEIKLAQELSELKAQTAIKDLENQSKIQALQPLENKVIKIHYAKAEDITNLLTKEANLLTARGSIGYDASSNSVWIRDEPDHIATVERLIRKLDYPEKQIEIDARIVSISRPFERQLGIRWGVSSTTYKMSGTLTGANAALSTPLNQVPVADRLNFNVPASTLQNSTAIPSSVGIALATLGKFNVDLELSALEAEGKVVMISKPRLITSNLKAAYIQNGQEIPYQEATSSGATSVSFKNASLSLKVTPRVTAHKRVLLEITLTNNSAGTPIPLTGTQGTAIPINTEEVSSTVLVNNEQTIVLGGIYTQNKQKTVTRIPFLGRIPLLGYLFKQTTIVNNRSELLIFLTTRVVSSPESLTRG